MHSDTKTHDSSQEDLLASPLVCMYIEKLFPDNQNPGKSLGDFVVIHIGGGEVPMQMPSYLPTG